MDNVPVLGKLIEGVAFRDAIHIAVYPAIAGEDLEPGERVGFLDDGLMYCHADDSKNIGIVDPFLHQGVGEGYKFWLCLFPNTVTSLRHVWTHPAFKVKPPEVRSE